MNPLDVAIRTVKQLSCVRHEFDTPLLYPGCAMKLLLTTNDPVQGSELADTLRTSGHLVMRAWSAGEALLLVRSDPPTLAIIDRCHGSAPEASKLAGYLLDHSVGVLWLGEAEDLPLPASNVLVAALQPPCDPASVAAAVDTLAQWSAGAEPPRQLSRLTIFTAD